MVVGDMETMTDRKVLPDVNVETWVISKLSRLDKFQILPEMIQLPLSSFSSHPLWHI